MHSPDLTSLIPVPIPLRRGVHSRVGPSGERLYFATTSTGALLNGEVRRRMPDESEAMLVRDMWIDLDRQDAISGPPTLSLYVNGVRRR